MFVWLNWVRKSQIVSCKFQSFSQSKYDFTCPSTCTSIMFLKRYWILFTWTYCWYEIYHLLVWILNMWLISNFRLTCPSLCGSHLTLRFLNICFNNKFVVWTFQVLSMFSLRVNWRVCDKFWRIIIDLHALFVDKLKMNTKLVITCQFNGRDWSLLVKHLEIENIHISSNYLSYLLCYVML